MICSRYKRGELLLRSDNLSSLAILREFITKEATMQKKRIQLSFKLDPDSISHSMSNLWPRMKRDMEHSRENLLLEALQVRCLLPYPCVKIVSSHAYKSLLLLNLVCLFRKLRCKRVTAAFLQQI